MKKLYETSDFLEAELIVQYLERHDIHAKVMNRETATTGPDMGIPFSIYVSPEQIEDAEQRLETFFEQDDSPN